MPKKSLDSISSHKNELRLSVTHDSKVGPSAFFCTAEGNAVAATYHFWVIFALSLSDTPVRSLYIHAVPNQPTSPLREAGKNEPGPFPVQIKDQGYKFTDDFQPIADEIQGYRLIKQNHIKILEYVFPPDEPLVKKYNQYIPDYNNPFPSAQIDPQANEYIGELLKGILEEAGYVVTIEAIEYYFPSPTSAGYLAPAFGLGLQREVKPIDIKDGFEIGYTYFSYKKSKTKTQIQYNFLDDIPEERLARIEKHLKENLTPYGLKCLYLVMRECSHNNRQPWFMLDTNRSLDIMGYKRNKKNVHLPRNKQRFHRELKALTEIDFNVEARASKRGSKDKEYVLKLNGPLLQITHLEVWEVTKGAEPKESDKIRDGLRIFIDPDIYSFIEKGWYTVFPDAFLKIDSGRRGHAIQLYQYITNQWRIGWHKYHGVFKQPMMQLLEGSGAISGFPKKRKNLQRDFVRKIIENLEWLKDQPHFWIKDVSIETKDRIPTNPMVMVTISDDHPLKLSMGKEEGA